MKNQLDVIISSVIFVIALIVAGAFFATKRQVVKPAPPTAPTLTAIKVPSPQPEMVNGLPLTSSANGASAAGGPPSGFPGGGGFSGGLPPSGFGSAGFPGGGAKGKGRGPGLGGG